MFNEGKMGRVNDSETMEGQAKEELFRRVENGMKMEKGDKSAEANMRAVEAAGREAFAVCKTPSQVEGLSKELEDKYFNHLPADPDSGPGVLRRLARERKEAIQAQSKGDFPESAK